MSVTRRFKVACIDMDGTLTTIPSSAYLGTAMGHAKLAEELERRYAAGEITNREVATAYAPHFRGRLKRDVWSILDGMPRVTGIRETVEALHGWGMAVLITTVAWAVVAEYLANRYGFDGYSGCVHGEDADGRLTAEVVAHFDEHDKARFVEEYCRNRGIDLKDCVAIGDSRSDIPLFGIVGRAIAFNGTPAARESADVCCEGGDLRVVLKEILPPA